MADSFNFDEQSARRIAKAVRAVERARLNLAPFERRELPIDNGDSFVPLFARLTAYPNTSSAKNYTGIVQQSDNAGGYADTSPAVTLTGQIFERKGFVGIELGAIVEIVADGTWTGSSLVLASGTAVYTFQFVLPRQFFAVKVYKTSGAAGPPSTWVYTAKTPDGDVIATGLTPELRRPSGTATTNPSDGTIGTGYYDATGAFHLWDANENC